MANGDELVSIKLPNAEIDDVLSALEMYTGKTILRPAQLPTQNITYSLRIAKPIPRSQAILYIETVLALNNIAVIPMGEDALKIVPLPSARIEAPELITGTTLDLPPSGRIAAKMFVLDFLRVGDFQPTLNTIINPNLAQIVPLQSANAILITDTVSNLQRIETILQIVDKPSSGGMATKFYQLRNGAKASDLVGKLRNILSGPIQAQLGLGTVYNADDRTNQVILISDPRLFPFFDDLINKLDVKADPNTRNEVIYLKHAKAADVVQVISRIIQTQNTALSRSQSVRGGSQPLQQTTPTPPSPMGTPAEPPQPQIVSASGGGDPNQPGSNEFSSLITVVNDDRSNSVVVSGTLDDIRIIKSLVDKLDIVLSQVRIEVVVAEVTLDDNNQSGISQLGLQVSGDKLVGFGLSGGSDGSSLTISGSGNSTLAEVIRNPNGSQDLQGLISMGTTPRKNNTTILTVPAIVTSHGKQAMINDGETRPVITGTTTYANAATAGAQSSSITQQVIGTTLTVTPFIGNDGSVQLDLQQELTDVTGTVVVDNNTQYIIGTRKTTSYVTARSGEIIVLGGFRKEIDGKSTNRLGPIPIIGDLLGPRRKRKFHQELIFFLRPTVLTNNAAVDNAEIFKRMEQLPTREQIKQNLYPDYKPKKESSIKLDKILPN